MYTHRQNELLVLVIAHSRGSLSLKQTTDFPEFFAEDSIEPRNGAFGGKNLPVSCIHDLLD